MSVGRQTFADLGYQGTAVEEIARRAGITKPVIYEHFGGKDGLYAAIVNQESEQLVAVIAGAISTGTPRQRVEAAILAFMRYVEEHPAGFTMLARDAPASMEYAHTLAEIADQVGRIFAVEFAKAGYDPANAPIYARALIGMVTFVAQWWDEERSLPVEEIADHLAALAWMGLRHLPNLPAPADPEGREAAAHQGTS